MPPRPPQSSFQHLLRRSVQEANIQPLEVSEVRLFGQITDLMRKIKRVKVPPNLYRFLIQAKARMVTATPNLGKRRGMGTGGDRSDDEDERGYRNETYSW
jgi:hypothetical protein